MFLEFLGACVSVGYQMSSASTSPVSASETSFPVEDRFAWEYCGSSLALMRDCAARFADSADPSRAFWFISRRIFHMVTGSSLILGNEARCAGSTAFPLHKSNYESLLRLLSVDSSEARFPGSGLDNYAALGLGHGVEPVKRMVRG